MSVLYLTEQYASVRLDDETLLVKIPEDKATGRAARKSRVPLNQITHVVIKSQNHSAETPGFSRGRKPRPPLSTLEKSGRLCYTDKA